jgi:DNA polymerase-4
VTAERLTEMGVRTVSDLVKLPKDELTARFGRHGRAMYHQARGVDRRPIVVEREAKSVSQERTFSRDIADARELLGRLEGLSGGVARRLQRSKLAAGTVAIKLRYADFTTLSRQMTLAVPTDDAEVIFQTAETLFVRTWQRGRSVRLLGVAGQHLTTPVGQLTLL